jgi:TolB-like protein/class 3 adenylate cyclase
MERLQRRLAAVLAMDVAGYSRLTETDVEGTHLRLRAIMDDIVQLVLDNTGGRIVKKTGDGALTEFPSVVEAVRAATRIQRLVEEQDQDFPQEKRIRLRMGINLGDVIVGADDDIYGDGVNIAARLEALARPGEIVISDAAVQTTDRTGYNFIDLGVQRLKNIARPLRVYSVVVLGDQDAHNAETMQSTSLVPGFGERPAIAVLPFKYRSSDPDQELFADAITEDVITALARWRHFPIIARNSVFTYKGRDVDLKSVALQLGVRYIIEGSLRKVGSRLRTSVQAIDVETMDNLLAEQYEYGVDEMFAVQEEIVSRIVGAIAPEVLRHEQVRALRTPARSASAYELYQRGAWHAYRYEREDNEKAHEYFLRALEFDPNYAHASAGIAIILWHAAHVGWVIDPKQYRDEAIRYARGAIRSDPRDPEGYYALAGTLINAGSPREAVPHLRQAIELDPSHAPAHAQLAFALNFLDRPQEALPEIQLALRLSPHEPRRFLWLPALAISHYLSGHYRVALAACQDALEARPDYPVAIRYLAATLGQLGRLQEARATLLLLARLDGNLAGSRAYMQRIYVPSATSHIVEGLQKAGFA